MNKRKYLSILAGVGVVVGLSASSCSDSGSTADQTTARQSDEVQAELERNQPFGRYTWSQQRETLRQIQDMQANTTPTYSYFFQEGREDARPVFFCASVGDPIPSTYQLTNSEKVVGNSHTGLATLTQIEPTGVFSGQSSATNVLCTTAAGAIYKAYWEGIVSSFTIEMEWDEPTGSLRPKAGAEPTATFTAGR